MLKIVMTNPYEVHGEGDKINALFKAGMDVLHIRKPKYSKKEIKALLDDIEVQYRKRVVLHSHYSLAKKYGLKGIHLSHGSDTLSFWNKLRLSWFSFRNTGLSISSSFTSVKALKKSSKHFSYVLLGPMFDKQREGQLKRRFKPLVLKNKLAKISTDVIAIGGVTDTNIERTKGLGFSGFCLLKFVWRSTDPVEAFLKASRAEEQAQRRLMAV